LKHPLDEASRPLRSIVAAVGVAALLVLISLMTAACGTQADSTATPAAPRAESTTTTDAAPNPTVTIRDTGVSTTSMPPASVPALASGITAEQVLELVAARSHIAPQDWELRAYETLGDWAVAELYSSLLSEQMDERGAAAVFEKREGAWFLADWVSLSEPPEQQMIELTNMRAPEEVWRYFRLEWKSAELLPPEQMPEDFGFVAAYGVGARNVIDTFAGTFTKDLGPSEEPVTTEFSLSREALDSLYRDLVLIQNQWWVFTTEFSPDPDPDNTGTTVFVQPYMTYRLEWRAGGFTSLPVVWEDSALSADPKAAALRGWFKKLQRLIEATPEWKALPPMTGGYA
jgi:hypothetical protein